MSLFVLALAGAFLVLPAGLLQVRLEDWLVPLGAAGDALPWLLFRAFVITALVEEAGKLALLLAWAQREPGADSRRWLAAGLALGGGFAALEATGNLIGGPLALLASLGLAVPSHLLDGVILASRARLPGGTWRGLGLVVLLHGLWDSGVFLLQSEPAGAGEEDLSLRMLAGVALVLGVYATQWYLGVRDGLAAYRGARTPQDVAGGGAGEGGRAADPGAAEAAGTPLESSSAEALGSEERRNQR